MDHQLLRRWPHIFITLQSTSFLLHYNSLFPTILFHWQTSSFQLLSSLKKTCTPSCLILTPSSKTFRTMKPSLFIATETTMSFPMTYTTRQTTKAQNIVTNVYRHVHHALYSFPGSVYLTYTRPSFPFLDGITAPACGHYPEAYFNTNLPNLAPALPYVDIEQVPITQYHPMEEYMQPNYLKCCLTIIWSFHSHDYWDPYNLLGPTPETFILPFYPLISTNAPFQLRLLFYKGTHLDELPEQTLLKTDFLIFLADKPYETPTIHVLAIIISYGDLSTWIRKW